MKERGRHDWSTWRPDTTIVSVGPPLVPFEGAPTKTTFHVVRKCIVCGHWECPCCNDWCDHFERYEPDDTGHMDVEICPCTRCVYEHRPAWWAALLFIALWEDGR